MVNRQRTDISAMRCIRLTTMISVALLAVIAAVVSFGHMRELALRHGEASWSATLIPFSVDGMVVAASMSVLLASRMGRCCEWLPWTLLIVGSLANRAEDGRLPAGAVIARHFNRSPRWGRLVKNAGDAGSLGLSSDEAVP